MQRLRCGPRLWSSNLLELRDGWLTERQARCLYKSLVLETVTIQKANKTTPTPVSSNDSKRLLVIQAYRVQTAICTSKRYINQHGHEIITELILCHRLLRGTKTRCFTFFWAYEPRGNPRDFCWRFGSSLCRLQQIASKAFGGAKPSPGVLLCVKLLGDSR